MLPTRFPDNNPATPRPRRARLSDDTLPSSSSPTPQHIRANIDEVLENLNAHWDLGLPRLRGAAAVQLESTQALAKRCSARLRYFCYRDIDLNLLLAEFESSAKLIYSKWVFKPLAESSVTPSRSTGDSALSKAVLKGKRPALTAAQRNDLLRCLDSVLEDPYALSRQSDSFSLQTQEPSMSPPRKPATINNMARATKPVSTPSPSSGDSQPKKVVNKKRRSTTEGNQGDKQRKSKTIRAFFAPTSDRNVALDDSESSATFVSAEDRPLVGSADETLLADDDTMDLFPTQDAEEFLQDETLLRSLDSGYASSTSSTIYTRLLRTCSDPRLDLCSGVKINYEYAWELQSLALSLGMNAKEIFYKVRNICHRDSPSVEERLSAYKEIAAGRSYEPFQRHSWLPAAGLPPEKRNHRSLYQEVTLTWNQTKDPESSPFKMRLHAPRFQKSNRFHRIYDGGRFLILNVPFLRASDIPSGLGDPEQYHEVVIEWLSNGLKIGGRFWRPFFVDQPKQTKAGAWFNQVNLFATTGLGLEQDPVSMKDFLNMHAPFEENLASTNHKLFARSKLGLSKTTPTVVLRKDEFLDTADIQSAEGNVMNDGCALMSVGLAIAITRMLGLDEVPSAFQGRISGAKGMWLVDKRNSMRQDPAGRGYWIQVTPAQLKIQPHPRYRDCSDHFRTFEVSDWSKALKPSSLNTQLLNVLYNRGVGRKILARRLTALTEEYYEELCDSIETNDPLLMHHWLQKYHSVMQRPELQFVGGRPVNKIEQIKVYLDVGFRPQEDKALRDLFKDTLRTYLDDFVEKPRIELPRSTFAYMVPDVWGFLEEGTVQLCLGRPWCDPETGLESIFIADIDVIVARNPANHPSDAQRVRAVHHPELAGYSNVIFFSTRGKRPLADYLSGGDYDGDQAFVCWDQAIVCDFKNYAPGPPDHIKPEDVGLVKCSTKLASVFKDGIDDRTVQEHLRTCLDFALRPSYLGVVTNTHVAHVYHQSLSGGFGGGIRALESHGAMMLAALASFLVDSAKQGYSLPHKEWLSLRKKLCGPNQLPKPAFLKSEIEVPDEFQSQNINDHLRFDIARVQKKTRLDEWWRLAQKWPSKQDQSLLRPFRAVDKRVDAERMAKQPHNDVYRQVFRQLKNSLDLVLEEWKKKVGGPQQGKDFSSGLKAINEVYASYKKIEPLKVSGKEDHVLYQLLEIGEEAGFYSWSLTVASYLYRHYYSNHSRFVWSMAGLDLCELKARDMGRAIPVMDRSYGAMKLNSRSVKLLSEMTVVDDEKLDLEMMDEDDETQFFDAQASLGGSPRQTIADYFNS
ncbi:uncharacterized protein HMPREF1541_10323 [Cyphellophora europaea CBS 101466]|uniref:RNA-dependent RNA polymerase n=1 Tax=Cyphellophora europaea (strain CBS 101466) TaxID=1220924 RepID=W2S9E1_CYPE1|nr:uncharacterized protein HMPREF1541_10323 [Cyphellophora europaea CBS 101466]ETN44653.1 hypothetical protein HMPREF1541_10323 [Cyphellophora europaea CBS 101466]